MTTEEEKKLTAAVKELKAKLIQLSKRIETLEQTKNEKKEKAS